MDHQKIFRRISTMCIEWWSHRSFRLGLYIVGSLLIVGSITGIYVWQRFNHKIARDVVVNTSEVSQPSNEQTMVRRMLDGVRVARGQENPIPVSVMIENFVIVRPQAGLQSASIVYEALAEGGITRFMAIFPGASSLDRIGPVRSARSYFVNIAEEYGGIFVHVGGSPASLNMLHTSSRVVDCDQIGGMQRFFWREKNTLAPHNVFTSSTLLAYALHETDLENTQSTFSSWEFTAPSKKEIRPTDEKFINISYYSPSYDVRYVYDRNQNVYRRWNGGEEHHDALTNTQITVKNIVVQFVDTTLEDAAAGRLNIDVIGRGRVIIFHDGYATEGEWERTGIAERTQFHDGDGKTMNFIPGNIWMELLPTDRTIEYN